MRKPRTETERKEFLGDICRQELERAEGGQSDDVQGSREKALKYYNCEPRGDEIEGRSQVISSDVADMVNATLAMLVPMLSRDCVVEFEPDGEDDEVSAMAEGQVVNQVIIEDNRGYLEIQEAVKDALLLKNGCMKIRVIEDVQTRTLDIEDASDEQIGALLMELPMNVEPEIRNDGKTLKLTETNISFETCAVPIENISYQAGYSGKLQDIRFFAERIEKTRSDLVEMGIKRSVVDELQPFSQAKTGTARQRNQAVSEVYDAETRDMDIIDCHECFLRVDLDGDGISERYRVLIANEGQCLEYEPHDLVPYSLGSPFLQPHRLTGESLADHLYQTQDSKTAFQRQWHDNVTAINNGRVVYDPSRTSEEDVLNPRAGGGIRSRDPGSSVLPLPIPDVGSGILGALQYEDQRRSERGGASLDLLSADAQMVGETAHGIERQYASREALASMLGRNLAETLIRGIYLLTHEMMRRHASRPYSVRINGQSQQVNPLEWPRRNRVNVKVGMSPGERGHLQQTLAMHVQMQMGAIQAGLNGILADAKTIYRTQVDWLRMAGIDNPERHVIDPESPQAQQAAQAQAEQAQAAQQAQAQMQERAIGIEERKIAAELQMKDKEIRHKYYDTDSDIAIAEAKISGEGVIELEKQRLTAESAERQAATRGAAGDQGGS